MNRARKLLRPEAVFALTILTILVFVAVFAPVLFPTDPRQTNLVDRLQPPVFAGGTWEYPLGTDALGRDILTRIAYGAQVSLAVGAGAVLLGGTIGMLAGVTAGFRGGRVDSLIMRLADVQLALPFILLALALLVALGTGLVNVILVLAIGQWVDYARVSRSEVLSLREREFIQASRVIGQPDSVIVRRHIVPNQLSTILVIASLAVGNVILAEAALSFLGAGVGVETPSWGGMIAEGRDYMTVAWWVSGMPGIVLMITILAVNLIGDWLRDVLDPRLRND